MADRALVSTVVRSAPDRGPFSMLKFRIMIHDADRHLNNLLCHNELDGFPFKIRNDPRVTGVGGMPRRFSIDELPQLINVLRGQMIIVGPRPPLRCEVAAYDADAARSLLVTPRMAGPWHVIGRRELSRKRHGAAGSFVCHNWSMAVGMAIMQKTVRADLGGRGRTE